MRTLRSFALLVVLGTLGCADVAGPDSVVVGGACTTDVDCERRCTHHGEFGAGMCTVSCITDNDCPEGAVCLEPDGGICGVSCASDRDCVDFGRAFVCKAKKRRSGGDALVCRLP